MGSSERRDSLQVEWGSPWSWTTEEHELLIQLKKSCMSWLGISNSLPGRTPHNCQDRYWLIIERNRMSLEGEEGKNELSRLYER